MDHFDHQHYLTPHEQIKALEIERTQLKSTITSLNQRQCFLEARFRTDRQRHRTGVSSSLGSSQKPSHHDSTTSVKLAEALKELETVKLQLHGVEKECVQLRKRLSEANGRGHRALRLENINAELQRRLEEAQGYSIYKSKTGTATKPTKSGQTKKKARNGLEDFVIGDDDSMADSEEEYNDADDMLSGDEDEADASDEDMMDIDEDILDKTPISQSRRPLATNITSPGSTFARIVYNRHQDGGRMYMRPAAQAPAAASRVAAPASSRHGNIQDGGQDSSSGNAAGGAPSRGLKRQAGVLADARIKQQYKPTEFDADVSY